MLFDALVLMLPTTFVPKEGAVSASMFNLLDALYPKKLNNLERIDAYERCQKDTGTKRQKCLVGWNNRVNLSIYVGAGNAGVNIYFISIYLFYLYTYIQHCCQIHSKHILLENIK